MKNFKLFALLLLLIGTTSISSINVLNSAQLEPPVHENIIPFVHATDNSLKAKLREGTLLLHKYEQFFTGTTYYFSSSGVTGNTGLSISSPWPLSKLSTTGVAGDSLLFKKGDTFNPSAVTYTRSGSSGSPIVIDCYGTAHNNPIFDGNGGSSPALYFNGASYIKINNIAVQNCSTSAQAPLSLNNCHDLTFYNCYAGLGKRGMILTSCTGTIVVNNCWFSKFTDAKSAVTGGFAPANGGGSGIQWQSCSGSGNKVINCLFYIDVLTDCGGVGDIISPYICFFGTGDTFTGVGNFGYEVAFNKVRGGGSAPPSSGFCGATGGDVDGSNQYIHDNTFINTGAVGIQIQGGNNINMSSNIIYSKDFSYTSVGIACANYHGTGVGFVMGSNVINFYSHSNSQVYNKYYDSGTTTQPTNWLTNTGDHVAASGAYDALLPDPLFSDGDWNTATTPLSFSALSSVNTGVADYSPGAVSSSNQGITYTSSNTAVATIVAKKIHVVGAGTTSITANDQFNSISQSLTVTATGAILYKGRRVHAN